MTNNFSKQIEMAKKSFWSDYKIFKQTTINKYKKNIDNFFKRSGGPHKSIFKWLRFFLEIEIIVLLFWAVIDNIQR